MEINQNYAQEYDSHSFLFWLDKENKTFILEEMEYVSKRTLWYYLQAKYG